jgi:hypothetical protein
MKVLIGLRSLIYQIVTAAFQSVNIKPKAAELGVLDGKNAEVIYKTMAPEKMYLIDSWSKEIFVDYNTNNAHRDWVDNNEKYAFYFGGALSNQATFDNLHKKTVDRFYGRGDVEIIRAGTRDALPLLKQSLGRDGKLDLIYVDASHQYETVLDDLMEYERLLSTHGFMQLNDCCHSADGMRQNLGVLEAAVKFCKATDFIPVLVTNTDWTDVLLVKKDSPMIKVVDQIVMINDISFVELPYQLFGALQVRYGKQKNLSFL